MYAKNKSTLIDKDVYWFDRDANADAYFSWRKGVGLDSFYHRHRTAPRNCP